MSTLSAIITGILLCILIFIGLWGMFSLHRLNKARDEASRTVPQAGEVWQQDGRPLYIKAVAKHGVMLFIDAGGGQPHAWWDSWDDWRARVRNRHVIKTDYVIPAQQQ